MARITSIVAAAALALSSTVAFAGGPVTEVETEGKPIVIAEGCSSSASLCPAGAIAGGLGGGAAAAAVAGALLLGAALSSGSH